MSLLLAFDTSGPYGSVAVGTSGRVLSTAVLEDRLEHAARLLPTIDAVLRDAGASVGEVSGVVVGEGPGSFTGVRVAAATAKGLALALGVPLRPVSSLAAAAAASAWVRSTSVPAGGSGAPQRSIRYVLFDARGDRVYGACYQVGPGAWEEVVPPHPGRIGEVLEGGVPVGTVFTGDGAAKHRSLLEHAGFEVTADADRLPLAVGLLACADLGGAPDAEDPSGWEPRYVRGSSAERLWSA